MYMKTKIIKKTNISASALLEDREIFIMGL
jgi:hypothetical protein